MPYLMKSFNDMLTNNIVSFEQLGPEKGAFVMSNHSIHIHEEKYVDAPCYLELCGVQIINKLLFLIRVCMVCLGLSVQIFRVNMVGLKKNKFRNKMVIFS